MSNTLAVVDPRSMTLIRSGQQWHPAWCQNRTDDTCQDRGHSSPWVSGESKRQHDDRPEVRWSFNVSESSDDDRGAHVWGMITVANSIIEEKTTTAVLMCDPIEAFLLGQDLIRASGFAYGDGLPVPAVQEPTPSRPKLEVVR